MSPCLRGERQSASKWLRGEIICGLLGLGLLAYALAGCQALPFLATAPTPTPTETPVPTETPGPSPTPDAVRPDDVVYVRRYIFGLSGDLYLVHTDGLAPRQITAFTRDQASAASDYPVWSPDHTTVAFASEYRDLYNLATWNLYRIDPQGQGAQQITGLPQPNGGYFPSLQCDIPGVSCWAIMTPPPGTTVRGRVLADGKPVAGAVVVSWLGRGFATTGADGTYTLENVPPGYGWIKATGEPGVGWAWVTANMSSVATAPDIVLDPGLGGAEYAFPAWDARGGLWALYRQHWFDPVTHDPLYQTHLVHLNMDGSNLKQVYTAQNTTMGRPRANPAHPAQVAVVDGTDLLLLDTDLNTAPGTAPHVTVLARNLLRDSPVAWAPDGSKIYYCLIGTLDPAYDSLRELTLATHATREVTLFRPDQQENSGFDISPDGGSVVYEENGDLFLRPLDAPPTTKPRHITYYGQGSQPTWGGR